MRVLHLIFAVGFALPLTAGEFAVLENGSRLHADRHEVAGSTVRLLSDSGVIEMPANRVVAFEVEDFVPGPDPVPAKSEPKTAAVSVASVAPLAAPLVPQDLAAAAARKFGLPSSFVVSVMKAESAFQTKAVSPKGALGLMQLMPGTARTLGVDAGDPRQNAEGGAQYLHELLARYENSPDQVLLALAAYNAGPGAVDRFHGVPPYRETRQYILRILKSWDQREVAK